MSAYVKRAWARISLRRKISIFAAMVIVVLCVSAAFHISITHFFMNSVEMILRDNSRCHEFQEALQLEQEAFEAYIKDRTPENREQYVLACVRSERCLRALPFDYNRIGQERYARTWNIRNAYESYSTLRDEAAERGMDAGYVEKLYQVYHLQSYLQTYARRLVQVTLTEASSSYRRKAQMFRMLPLLSLSASGAVIAVMMLLTKVLSGSILTPIVILAGEARKIGANDFSEQDLKVDNEDEIGELVGAFNKMKHSTEAYINALKEKNEMSQLLHREELEKMKMETDLDAARLELLKSQINPHFLFNTLSMISCMAQLEDAATTERMITCLSSLFRYNLKTTEQVVPLSRELKVVQDYVYIQQMRFGNRLRYECVLETDAETTMLPAFTLQPLVENAVIHGISKKEQGGRIRVRVRKKKDCIFVLVADNGQGMSRERLMLLREALRERRTSKVGIGIGNIYQRIHRMYPEGHVRIYSAAGRGTAVQMIIPQEAGKYVSDIDCR